MVVVVHYIVGLVEVDKCARERDEHIVICMDSILSLYSIIKVSLIKKGKTVSLQNELNVRKFRFQGSILNWLFRIKIHQQYIKIEMHRYFITKRDLFANSTGFMRHIGKFIILPIKYRLI